MRLILATAVILACGTGMLSVANGQPTGQMLTNCTGDKFNTLDGSFCVGVVTGYIDGLMDQQEKPNEVCITGQISGAIVADEVTAALRNDPSLVSKPGNEVIFDVLAHKYPCKN